MESIHILFVGVAASARDLPAMRGGDPSWQLETVSSGWVALERVQSGSGPNVVLLNLPDGDSDGLHMLRWMRRLRPDLPVILLSSSDDPSQKLEAIRLGAEDYLLQPLQAEQLEAAIRRSLAHSPESAEGEIVADEIEHIGDDVFFVAASPSMRKLRAQAELLAQVSAPVLIVGEQGSGKELAARLIHKLSVRSGSRFLKLDCSTLPGDALENELFGVANGNGPTKPGKLESCHLGTLLLDEITEMPLSLQAKLLHVLRDGYFIRQGRDFEVDVRILAASRIHIKQALAERRLREDLYYWLSEFTVHVPALRQRKEEIPLLLSHLMNQLARRYSLPARVFSGAALKACQQHSWPGNLGELENFAKRYLVMGDVGSAPSRDGDMAFWDAYLPPTADRNQSDHRASENLRFEHREVVMEASTPGISDLKSLIQSVKGEAERNAIAGALDQARWNRKAAARLLKVSYRTLLYKIEHYHMSPPERQFSGYGGSTSFR